MGVSGNDDTDESYGGGSGWTSRSRWLGGSGIEHDDGQLQ
jgi:hypothetical protein